jgi:hypothetical protein
MADAEDSEWTNTPIFFIFYFLTALFVSRRWKTLKTQNGPTLLILTSSWAVRICTYVCGTHICIYVCGWYMYICVYTTIFYYIFVLRTHIVYVHMCLVHIYVYMCVRICIYVSLRLYSTIYVSSGIGVLQDTCSNI